jgi:hypothetical protein
MEVRGRAARRRGVTTAGRIGLPLPRLGDGRELLRRTALGGEPKVQRVGRLAHLLQVGDVGIGELPHDGPAPRARGDQPFRDERTQGVPHRYPAHAQLRREVTLDQTTAGPARAVDDLLPHGTGDAQRLGLEAARRSRRRFGGRRGHGRHPARK